jgi:hypothetical protein
LTLIHEAIDAGEFTLGDWLDLGLEQRWCGPPVCTTHDGIPSTEAEDAEFEEGDPCISMIRPYVDAEEADAVEANHAPSVWRKPRVTEPF